MSPWQGLSSLIMACPCAQFRVLVSYPVAVTIWGVQPSL
ncbi:hypothetical protein AAKU64_004544 [Undibacterium sp. GrIS 1.8]